MEILTRLENRIEEILARVKELEAENSRLKRDLEEGSTALETENLRLRTELDREKAAKEAVVTRIDNLLKKISGETGEPSFSLVEAEKEEDLGFGFAPDTE